MLSRPRRVLVASLAVTLALACAESTAPRAGAPTRVVAVAGRVFGAVVEREADAPLVVRVTDQHARPVAGATVRFGVAQGNGIALSPESAVTDADGRAATRVRAGTLAGEVGVVATVPGVAAPASFSGVVLPGPVARVAIAPRLVRLTGVGSASLPRVDVQDRHGNVVASGQVTYASTDPTLVSVDAGGVVRALRAGASAQLVATAGGLSDTATVSVADPALRPCDAASTVLAPEIGEVHQIAAVGALCVRAGAAGAQLVVIPFSHATSVFAGTPVELLPLGTANPAGEGEPHARALPSAAPERDAGLDARLRASERDLVVRAARERDAGEVAVRAIPSSASLGQLVALNTNSTQECRDPDVRTGRVVALSERAVVVADTANPPGGFTDADYRHFAVTFDTLVHAVDAPAFGAPQDIDGNGRVVIFFTRAVNELSPANASYYVGGFFWARDFLGPGGCAGSNGGEMFYMLVPDPDGVVRDAKGGQSRAFARGFVDSVTVATLAHEYQHLINASRRLYVTRTATPEAPWLNEALSHVAEELVFHRQGGTTPRSNLDGTRFGDARYDAAFLQYAMPNLGRLRSWLQNPESFSPFADDFGTGTSVQSRGASWAFLRYLADHRAADDADVWYRLVNAASSGFANLQQVFGVDPMAALRDFAVSVYVDDLVPGLPARFTQPSWNFRSIFPAVPGNARAFPLATHALRAEITAGTGLRAGAAAYFRFAVPANGESYLQFASGGLPVPASLRFLVVRTR
jgi:hypothetical protein